MGPEGHEALIQAVGEDIDIYPSVGSGEDVPFVHIDVDAPGNVRAFLLTDVLNRMTEAGLMERHGPSDSFSSHLPAFRVVAIDGSVVYLEDTNSKQY